MMPSHFRYEATNCSGDIHLGKLKAADRLDALRQLERRGLIPIVIDTESRGSRPTGGRDAGFGRSRTDLLAILKELTMLMKSGVPLAPAIELLATQAPNQDQGCMLADIAARLRDGHCFSAALRAGAPKLPPQMLAVATAGEESGHLGEALEAAIRQMEYDALVHNEVRGALVYPSVILVTGIGAVLFILLTVVPKFAGMMASAGDRLPAVSKVVLSVGMTLHNNTAMLAGVSAALLAAVLIAGRRADVRAAAARLARRIPVIGPCLIASDIARWAAVLALMVRSGVDFTRALELAERSVVDVEFAARLHQVKRAVRAGRMLSGALEEHGALPVRAINLIRVGEQAAALPDTLDTLAASCDQKRRERIRGFLRLLEPVSILVIGTVVGTIVASILFAITSINDLII
jgi:general secretion pathway protein F